MTLIYPMRPRDVSRAVQGWMLMDELRVCRGTDFIDYSDRSARPRITVHRKAEGNLRCQVERASED
jgi:hypothetical protein